MNAINIKEKAYNILNESTRLWYEVVPENMKRGGHPGVEGANGNVEESLEPSYYILRGAIFTLEQVVNELKNK